MQSFLKVLKLEISENLIKEQEIATRDNECWIETFQIEGDLNTLKYWQW